MKEMHPRRYAPSRPECILLWVWMSLMISSLVGLVACGGENPQKPDVIIEKPTPVNVKVQVPDEIAVQQPIRVIPVSLNAGGLEMIVEGVGWGSGSVWGMERLWLWTTSRSK